MPVWKGAGGVYVRVNSILTAVIFGRVGFLDILLALVF